MASFGSYIRFGVGILLSLDVLRIAVFGGSMIFSQILAIVFLLLAILFFAAGF